VKGFSVIGQGLPRQREGIRMLRLDQECVLCDHEGRRLCALNETAAALWELCDGETTLEEMVEAVCLVCNVDRESAAVDIERTLAELSRAGLLEWRAASGGSG
jgi:pyrroloquinoline quinone biosynthesis protein D